MVKRAMRDAEERQSILRQSFPLRATPIVQQAAYEPALFHHQLPNISEGLSEGTTFSVLFVTVLIPLKIKGKILFSRFY